MIKVLHVLPGLQPNDGISTVFMNYMRTVDHNRFVFDVICHWPYNETYKEEVESYGGKVSYFPRIDVKNYADTYRSINQYFENNKDISVVHCHMANAAFLYLKAAKKHGINLRILHSHQDHYADTKLHALRNVPLVALGKKWSNYNLACSKVAGDFLFKNDSYSILKNSIDASCFAFSEEKRDRCRSMFGISPDQIVYASIGRLTSQKNQSFVLEIFKRIHEINSKTLLLVVGEGQLEDELKQKADDLNISNSVIWLKNILDMDVLYQAIDILIFPSLYEGLPLTLIEAQAAGIQCFVSGTVSSEAIVSSKTKVLPLESGADYWAKSVMSSQNLNNREEGVCEVKNAGYDISNTKHILESIYSRVESEQR